MAITRAQQYRQMLKNGKVAMQGGVKNYLGKKKMVTVPKNWQSGPDHPKTELAYITKAEKDLLIKKDLHNSLNGRPNRGPAGVMSLNGWGDKGDTSDRSYGGGNVSGSGDNKDYSGYKDTGTGNYQKSTNQADIEARKEYEKAKKERERQEKIQEQVNKYNQKKVEKLKSFVNKDILDLISEDELDDVDVTDKGIFGNLNDIRTDLSRKTLVNSIAQKLGAMPKSYVPSVFMSDMMRSTPKGITTDSLTDMLSPDFDMGLYGISGKDLTKAQQQLDVAKQDTISQSDFDSVYGNKPPEERGDGGNNQVYIPPVVSSVVEPEEEIDPNSLQGLLANRVAYRFMADGGRAGFQQGSPAPIAPKVDPRMAKSLQENIAANEAQRTSNITRKEAQRKAIEDIRNAISSGGKEGLGSFLQQQFGVANPSQVPGYSSYDSPLTGVSSFAKDRITNALIQNYLNPSAQGSGTYGSGNSINPYASMFVQTPGGMFGNPNPYDVSSAVQSGYGVMLDGNLYKSEQDAIDALGIERYNQLMADGGRAGFMDGGMSEDDFIGGLADGNLDEMGRQMYGLGKLVKKATRAVKKIVKSPVGKAALAFGMYKFGAPLFKSEGFKKFFLKDAGKKFALDNLSSKGILAGIGGISALSGLMSQPEEDEEETYYRGPGLDINAIRRDPYGSKGPAYGFYAEGGDVKEPVAKDTMPLLDMNGMEKDYRADGGFVPIGRMERADDVPARLSKNEFVFTADAVRNAGDGDVDKGAEVMYNMMKNLESGGKVSEESQGLDGARDMFQTSKRLEEVL